MITGLADAMRKITFYISGMNFNQYPIKGFNLPHNSLSKLETAN